MKQNSQFFTSKDVFKFPKKIMEGVNIDISNPDNFVWKGSIIHDFDKESITRLSSIKQETHLALSRSKRKGYTKTKLINLKDHLEFLANQQLLQLDLYTAALKHDARVLSTKNVGIAASIDNAISQMSKNQEHFQTVVKQQQEEFENEEKKKSEELQKEYEKVKEEAEEQSKKAKSLEKTANDLKAKAEKHSILIRNFNRYNEWIRLNNVLIDLQKKRKNIENTTRMSQNNQSGGQSMGVFYIEDDQ